jgi:hypothetical protein
MALLRKALEAGWDPTAVTEQIRVRMDWVLDPVRAVPQSASMIVVAVRPLHKPCSSTIRFIVIPTSDRIASLTFNRTTAQIIQWESSLYGRYPFSSTGGIIADVGVGYALETQSRPVYDQRTSELDGDLLAHELGHQWFGDSLTPVHWSDIWLNEGFATYSEWLYQEEFNGTPVEQRHCKRCA